MSAVTAVPIQPLARGSVLKLWLALLVLLAAAAGLAWWGTQSLQVVTLESGVRYRTLTSGHGPAMTPADVIAMRYKLHVGDIDAPVIQDSDESGQPFVTTTGEVFPGFAEGLQKMRAGGRYLLWLPPGTHSTMPPPPNAPFSQTDTLAFEIEVLQIVPGMAERRQMEQMQRLQQMMQQQAPPEGGAAPGPEGPAVPGRGPGRGN